MSGMCKRMQNDGCLLIAFQNLKTKLRVIWSPHRVLSIYRLHMELLLIGNNHCHPTHSQLHVVGHVMRNMTVKGPVSRIVCSKFQVICFSWSYINCAFYKPILNRYGIAVADWYSKLVPMDMHGMGVVHDSFRQSTRQDAGKRTGAVPERGGKNQSWAAGSDCDYRFAFPTGVGHGGDMLIHADVQTIPEIQCLRNAE